MRVAKLLLLAGLWAVVAASASQQGDRRQPPATYRSSSPPGNGVYACTDLDSRETHGSLCFADAARCEDARAAAENDGVRALPCRDQTPVSCFQRGNDPRPEATVCAATADDCDLWRLIDQDKHGQTGAPCVWRGPGTTGG